MKNIFGPLLDKPHGSDMRKFHRFFWRPIQGSLEFQLEDPLGIFLEHPFHIWLLSASIERSVLYCLLEVTRWSTIKKKSIGFYLKSLWAFIKNLFAHLLEDTPLMLEKYVLWLLRENLFWKIMVLSEFFFWHFPSRPFQFPSIF